jgi:inosine-uridine nucleoside N-ribohydrolase
MKIARFFLGLCALALVAAGASAARGQQPFAVIPPLAEPQLVILDTDIGDDIDDAFALALALRSPELRILGITTTFGDTELRAKLLDRFLSATDQRIDVVPGVPTPHNNVLTQAAYAGWESSAACFGAGSILFTTNLLTTKDAARLERVTGQQQNHDAVGFLLDQIKAHPGRITLIAIGPLFNVQAAIERDPATFRQLKRVVLMGGSVYRGYDGANGERRAPDAEWNIDRDPAGAKALLATGVPVFMMPLDSTQIHLEADAREKIFSHGSPLTDQLTLLYHQWLAGNDGHAAAPTLFDPVAVAYAVRPDLCPAKPMRLEVDDKGFTRPVEGAPNVQVCLQSDEKGFLKFYLGRVVGETTR